METSDSSIPWLTPTCHQTLPSHPGATQPLSMKAELHKASLLQPNAGKQSRCLPPKSPSRPASEACQTNYPEGRTAQSLPPLAPMHHDREIVDQAGPENPNAVLEQDDQDEEHEVAAPCQLVAKATSYALSFTKSSLLWGPRPRPQTAPCLATKPNRTVTTKKSKHTAKVYSPTPERQQQTHSPGLPAARVAPPSPSRHSVQRLPARMTGSRPPRLW